MRPGPQPERGKRMIGGPNPMFAEVADALRGSAAPGRARTAVEPSAASVRAFKEDGGPGRPQPAAPVPEAPRVDRYTAGSHRQVSSWGTTRPMPGKGRW